MLKNGLRAKCKANGCDAEIRRDNRSGYCQRHTRGNNQTRRKCAAPDCGRVLRHGRKSPFCSKHYSNHLVKEIDGHAEHVICEGNVLLYSQKGYQTSGKSIFGALEYDKDSDLIKCHECGTYLPTLGRHINASHGIRADEYKRKHGLRQETALINESTRTRLIAQAQKSIREGKLTPFVQGRDGGFISSSIHTTTGEMRNRRENCYVQIPYKLAKLAKSLGRTPTLSEMKRNGIHPKNIEFHFGSVKRAVLLAGLMPRRKGGNMAAKWSPSTLILTLRNFIETRHRLPSPSDIRRGTLPPQYVFNRHFGNLRKAIMSAGYKPYPEYRKRGVRIDTSSFPLEKIGVNHA